jgi:hypothetical protein
MKQKENRAVEILKEKGGWMRWKDLTDAIIGKYHVCDKTANNDLKKALKGEAIKIEMPDRTVLYGLRSFPIRSELLADMNPESKSKADNRFGFFNWLRLGVEEKQQKKLELLAKLDADRELAMMPDWYDPEKRSIVIHKHRKRYGLEAC